jgi:hypothetical protein
MNQTVKQIKNSNISLILFISIIAASAGALIATQLQKNHSSHTEGLATAEDSCETKCLSYKANSTKKDSMLEYCTSTFQHDVDQDGKISEVAGSGYNSYCEDGVKCFNIHTCEADNKTFNAANCAQFIEENYPKKSKKIISRAYGISEHSGHGSGTCNLRELTDSKGIRASTWHESLREKYSLNQN